MDKPLTRIKRIGTCVCVALDDSHVQTPSHPHCYGAGEFLGKFCDNPEGSWSEKKSRRPLALSGISYVEVEGGPIRLFD